MERQHRGASSLFYFYLFLFSPQFSDIKNLAKFPTKLVEFTLGKKKSPKFSNLQIYYKNPIGFGNLYNQIFLYLKELM
jgi:hypothetical protein